MTVDDRVFQQTYQNWLQQALARDATRWAELERELARLRQERAQTQTAKAAR